MYAVVRLQDHILQGLLVDVLCDEFISIQKAEKFRYDWLVKHPDFNPQLCQVLQYE